MNMTTPEDSSKKTWETVNGLIDDANMAALLDELRSTEELKHFARRFNAREDVLFEKIYPIYMRFAAAEQRLGTQTRVEDFINYISGESLPSDTVMGEIREVLASDPELLNARIQLQIDLEHGEWSNALEEWQSLVTDPDQPYPEALQQQIARWKEEVEDTIAESDPEEDPIKQEEYRAYVAGEMPDGERTDRLRQIVASTTDMLKDHLLYMRLSGRSPEEIEAERASLVSKE